MMERPLLSSDDADCRTPRRCRGWCFSTALIYFSLLVAFGPAVIVAEDSAAATASSSGGRAQVEVGVDGATDTASAAPCNCSGEVSSVQKILESCREDHRLSAASEAELRSKLDGAAVDAEVRVASAAADAEARATAVADEKLTALRSEVSSAELKAAAADRALVEARDELEKEKEAAADRHSRLSSECEAKSAAADEALSKALAELKEAMTSLAAARKEKAEADVEMERAAGRHGEELAAVERKLEDATAGAAERAEEASHCRLSLVESESDRNEAIQEMTALKDSIVRTEKDHEKKSAKLSEQLAEMKKDAERQKRLLKAANDKNLESRRDLHARESELRDMHRKATSQYINTTLLLEDAAKKADVALTHTENFASRVWADMTELAGPYLSVMRKEAGALFEKAKDFITPYAETARKQYQRSIHPHLLNVQKPIAKAYARHAKPYIDPLWEEYGTPAAAKLSDIRMTIRLSFVSALQQSCRTLATYIQLMEDGKKMSPRKKSIVRRLQATDKNAEDVVDMAGRYLAGFLALLFFGEYALRNVLFVLLLPFWPIRFLFGRGDPVVKEARGVAKGQSKGKKKKKQVDQKVPMNAMHSQ